MSVERVSEAARRAILAAFSAIRRNRVQAGLAIFGMAIGVAALLTSLALGQGAKAAIQSQIEAAGANRMIVRSGNYQPASTRPGQEATGHHAEDVSWTPPTPEAPALDLLQRAVWTGQQHGPAFPPSGHEAQPLLKRVHEGSEDAVVIPIPTARPGDFMPGAGAAASLSVADAVAIRKGVPGVRNAAPVVQDEAWISSSTEGHPQQRYTRLYGVDRSILDVRRNARVMQGRFFSPREMKSGEAVVVLGRYLSDRLFGEGSNPVGRRVVIRNRAFRVIGLMGSLGSGAAPSAGDEQFDAAYAPLVTVRGDDRDGELTSIIVTTRSAADTRRAAEDVRKLLRVRHGVADTQPDDFTVSLEAATLLGRGVAPELVRELAGNISEMDALDAAAFYRALQSADRTMLVLLTGAASTSLFVGAVGVLNVMLLAVSRRSREIAVRIVMGAERRDIMLQFLCEAALLGLIGASVGTVLGIVSILVVQQTLGWTALLSFPTALFIAIASLFVSMGAGLIPARRAALIEPAIILKRG